MRKILYKLTQVIVFFVLLELFFIAGGMVNRWAQIYSNKRKLTSNDTYVIVCIGESLTLVGEEDSYPSQLQRILNEQTDGGKFTVINEGAAGQGTLYFSRQLPEIIDRYHPDMVVSMLGSVDPLKAKKSNESVFVRFVKNLRLYRLFARLMDSFKEPKIFVRESKKVKVNPIIYKRMFRMFLLGEVYEGKKDYLAAEKIYDKLYELNKKYPAFDDDAITKKICQNIIWQKDYDKLISRMRELPYDSWEMNWIKYYCHGEQHTQRIREIIESIIEDNPGKYPVYGYLAACYKEAGMPEKADEYLKRIDKLSDAPYSDYTNKYYRKILRILFDNGVQPVIVQYPLRKIGPLKDIFVTDKKYEKILFVDNESVFRNALSPDSYGTYFTDRTMGDIGHMTNIGKRLLAGNIADKIIKLLLLK